MYRQNAANPEMSPPIPPEEEIFEAAISCTTPEKRQAYLDEVCDGRPELRGRVEALLAAHHQAGPFLNPPVAARPRTIKLSLPAEEAPGTVIGRYKLLEKVGEGGFGVVYVAEQREPVKRRVALKIIKLGMDTRQVVARFEAERQALALMDHPNIARVLDAGATETGRPFFVMELVRGIKITEYCDQNKLTTNERLNLFIQVCHAIQHAHQKGIVHRDIKPSNILVALHDGVPIPKVIDFGIAKATQGELTDKTVYTQFQQFIGTPAYMSPEQAEMSGLDVDTRSDVYSLGVLLYELLTGRTPFDQQELLQAGLEGMRKMIREVEPVRPSTRVHSLAADDRTTTAVRRQTEAPKLIHLLRGDLDWVVMKSLEKDRTRRYETANGMAMDLRRYLTHEPVVARPPSKLYRFQKTVRRHKLVCTAGLLTTLALLAGSIVSVLQAVRARQAETQARHEKDAATRARQQAEAINRFLTDDLLYQATPDQNAREKQVTMEEVLEKATRKLDRDSSLAGHPEIEAKLRFEIGTTFYRLGLLQEAEQQLRRAGDLCRAMGRQDRQALTSQLQLCDLLLNHLFRVEDGEQLSFETWQGFQRLAQANPADKTLYRDTLNAEAGWIWALAMRGQYEKAVPLKRKNVAAFERAFGPADHETLTESVNLANMMILLGDYAEAERITRATRAHWEQAGLGDRQEALAGLVTLAQALLCQNHAAEAETLLQQAHPNAVRALGPAAPQTLLVQYTLARAIGDQGRLAEGANLAREALDLQQRAENPNHWNTGNMMLVLGRLLVDQGHHDQAQPYLESARQLFQQSHFTHRFEKIVVTENLLGAIQLARTNYIDAARLIEPHAEQFVRPGAIVAISPNERRGAIGQIVALFQAVGQPGKASEWKRRFDQVSEPADRKQASAPAPARSAPDSAPPP